MSVLRILKVEGTVYNYWTLRVLIFVRIMGIKGARSCVGGSCAAVAMGVNQANYSTYIQIGQLYITIMQTAVFTKKIVLIPQTLFKI